MLLHSNSSGMLPGPDQDTRPVLVILHGLFGSSDNWGSLRRQLERHFRVVALDLRNHGQSGHDPAIDYDIMAGDVEQTLAHLQIDRYHLLGHSMGGKVAMTMAGFAALGIDKLVVVDIAPKDYPPHHQPILQALLALDTNSLESRNQADQALRGSLPDSAVRQFLLKNLVRSAPNNNAQPHSGFHWLFNLQALNANYTSLTKTPDANGVFTKPVLVLRGSESDYVQDQDNSLFASRFSQFQLRTINGAGHWPHASHAAQVIDELLAFLL